MAQIVENWADLTVRLLDDVSAADDAGLVRVRVLVERSDVVEDLDANTPFRNLLVDTTGEAIDVLMRQGELGPETLRPGSRLVLRARKAAQGRVFAYPLNSPVEPSNDEMS